MQLLVTVAVLFSILATSMADTLCKDTVCQGSDVCYEVETCDANNACSLEATCLGADYDAPGGCIDTRPLLTGSGYGARVCHAKKVCPSGYYCSTELMDTFARCCRAAPAAAENPGQCPAPVDEDNHFCVDECLSDADCHSGSKCCRSTVSCPARMCLYPPSGN
ncbi:uncharacterized protein LOC143297980 [Babylonia areolata]|uniref:uncharacterized protein LOC143297980 n=1 Tax=Babylonia areolata TaxID=304850 RepID=UPI003FD22A0B